MGGCCWIKKQGKPDVKCSEQLSTRTQAPVPTRDERMPRMLPSVGRNRRARRQSQSLLPLTQTGQQHVDTGLSGSLAHAPRKLKLRKRKAETKSDITHDAVGRFSRGLCPPTEN